MKPVAQPTAEPPAPVARVMQGGCIEKWDAFYSLSPGAYLYAAAPALLPAPADVPDVQDHLAGASQVDRCARALVEVVALEEPNYRPRNEYIARYERAWAEARAAVEALGAASPFAHVAPETDQQNQSAVQPAADALTAWVFEWGAVSLPVGHPSRVTCMSIHATEDEANAQSAECEFDWRVYAVQLRGTAPKAAEPPAGLSSEDTTP